MITAKNSSVAGLGIATEYYGLSTDTKPSEVPNGSTFLEMNTGNVYIYDAANGAWLSLTGDSSSNIASGDSNANGGGK